MKQKFYAVIDYVKNLFPGCAPVARSKTAYMDARVLSKMALETSYVDVADKQKFWYCCVKCDDLPVARYIMSNLSSVTNADISDSVYSETLQWIWGNL